MLLLISKFLNVVFLKPLLFHLFIHLWEGNFSKFFLNLHFFQIHDSKSFLYFFYYVLDFLCNSWRFYVNRVYFLFWSLSLSFSAYLPWPNPEIQVGSLRQVLSCDVRRNSFNILPLNMIQIVVFS